MATMLDLESKLNQIALEEEDNQKVKWDLPLKELYKLALAFYKEKSGKAIHLSYEDNLKLIAFTQQAAHGQFDPNTAPQLGVLDVIGRDRRLAWQSLGLVSKTEAQESFIDMLDRLCPTLRPYIEAIKKDKEEKLRKELEEKQKAQELLEQEKKLQEEKKEFEEQCYKEEMQKRQLQDALNQQTFNQFKTYAEKQYPGNPEQQGILIRQLQNEHYHQYMQQLHAQIKFTNASNSDNQSESPIDMDNCVDIAEKDSSILKDEADGKEDDCADDSGEYLIISPARMWTRPDIKNFKQDVAAGSGEGVIHVGHGDTVTVRVPTHEGGTCIFWEFATDSYDIGFGVYFEWTKPVSNEVTVHISESDDEDEFYEDDDDEFGGGDLECGPVQTRASISPNRPPISIIVPVYRRECQNEIYVGSHQYPGEGIYLLKFDNSYSIWRSKTLYYRVYYERLDEIEN
ncbi:Golgi resident protein GCP60 [Condylostylus longicornis]|uniref:Golgi resident protein GCP60 n=1 Tax=Condylostylus longicornis TaxID=2530218 RepID=UPI00244DACA3|nr:Golgi resident protein GCP60 [Condylostylus longicornis]